MPLKFSVVTPSYNQGQFIERTIQSVLAQTDVAFEYVVFDGGSSDNTLAILKQYEGYLQWLSEPDGGQADAVNKGICSTTGDIIAWINSDDIYYPSALSKVEHIFETHPEVQVIYGHANHIDEQDQVIEPYPTEPWIYERLKEYCFICQPATFFRRTLVDAYGPLNSELKFCMDYELWLRYGQHTQFFYLSEVLAGSRLYQNTKTLGQRVAVHFETNEMLREKFSVSPEKWVFAYALTVVDERDKSENRNLKDLRVNIQRANEFCVEVFRGYSRWRNMYFSPLILWRIFRWTVAVGYRLFHKKNPL